MSVNSAEAEKRGPMHHDPAGGLSTAPVTPLDVFLNIPLLRSIFQTSLSGLYDGNGLNLKWGGVETSKKHPTAHSVISLFFPADSCLYFIFFFPYLFFLSFGERGMQCSSLGRNKSRSFYIAFALCHITRTPPESRLWSSDLAVRLQWRTALLPLIPRPCHVSMVNGRGSEIRCLVFVPHPLQSDSTK